MLVDPVILSCTHTPTHRLSMVLPSAICDKLKLTFNRFHGDQNKVFLYWQRSHSQPQCVLFYLNIEGRFMTEEQAPTPSRVLPDASMSWLIFFLPGYRPTSCQSLFAAHQITFWRWWQPNNIFVRSELISPPPGRLKKEMRCRCPFAALPTVATVKRMFIQTQILIFDCGSTVCTK